MKNVAATALFGALLALPAAARPTVDEEYPYTGPAIPIGDWVDQTVNGNGKGFPRLVEPPAVTPASKNPTNNVNVIHLSYMPNGINIHYQTPFGLGKAPTVKWGSSPKALTKTATGFSHSYNRTPPCSMVSAVTQCSEYFHEVTIGDLQPGATYYYKILASNGTTESDVLSFTTARRAGDKKEFSIAVLNDMGYTNAKGTHKYLSQAVDEGISFVWHGGDISYADDWYSGILACADDWPVCYNGTDTALPGGGPIPKEYDAPLPAGEIPNQGGPQGGDFSPIYENNWDLWQQWMTTITSKVPYMVLPGNHEPACAEFDGPGNILTAYLNLNETNSTAPTSDLTYYSCPPSQRNFTAYTHRFKMPGGAKPDLSVGNFWYSFDYGMTHFVSIDTETDFADSPEWPFIHDTDGKLVHPTEDETYVTDSGPFGAIDDEDYTDNKAYQQYQWMAKDLAAVDRTVTPWVVVMGHRPMYSSQVSSYQGDIRSAFEALMLQNEVDVYLSGHIHWYERLVPMGFNGSADFGSILNNNTYYTNPGKSMTHLVNGMAGNIESHSTISTPPLNISEVLDQTHYGFSKMSFTLDAMKWEFIKGDGTGIRDSFTLLKKKTTAPYGNSTTSSSAATSTGMSSSTTKYTTSTVFTTTTRTITSCAPTVTNCPARSTTVVTDTIAVTTTVCPVTETETSTPAPVTTTTIPAEETSTVECSTSTPEVWSTATTECETSTMPWSTPVVSVSSPASNMTWPASTGKWASTTTPVIVPSTPVGPVVSSIPTAAAGRLAPAAGLAGLLGFAVFAL